MMLSKLSFVSILILLGLVLSDQRLTAQQIPSPEPTTSNPPSNPPTPSSRKESQPSQKQPQARKKTPAPDNRGTENAPFVIKIIDTPKPDLNPSKIKSDTNESTPPNGWIYWGVPWRAEVWASIFSLIMVAITLGQLRMFFKQLRIMRDTLNISSTPKLDVDRVRAIDWQAGKKPIFLVRIVNAGPIIAEHVSVLIRVEGDTNFNGVKYSDNATIEISVPPNSGRELHIMGSEPLTDAQLEGLNTGKIRLRINGLWKYKKNEKEYCYKYYPYDGERPEELPQFIPCDYPAKITILKFITGSVGAKVTVSGDLTVTPSAGTPPPDITSTP